MTVHRIVRYPSDLLFAVAPASFPLNEQSLELIRDLEETLEATPHGLALAANQVPFGCIRAFVVRKTPENEKLFGGCVCINPTLVVNSGVVPTSESCLSLPDVRALVDRSPQVIITFFDVSGEKHVVQLDGLPAQIAQHECDHLDGTVFIDRLPRKQRFQLRALAKKNKKAGR